MKKVLSFDAETNGLWGEAFAIGAIVFGENGEEINRFVGRCPIEGMIDPWVDQNVLPQIKEIDVTHENYCNLIKDFSEFYLLEGKDCEILVNVGFPVETTILLDMHRLGFIKDSEAPYPLFDISSFLAANMEDPLKLENFLSENKIKMKGNYGGFAHNPLFDCEAAARAYFYLKKDGNNQA